MASWILSIAWLFLMITMYVADRHVRKMIANSRHLIEQNEEILKTYQELLAKLDELEDDGSITIARFGTN